MNALRGARRVPSKIISIAGTITMLLSLYFVFRQITGNWGQISDSLTGLHLSSLILAIPLVFLMLVLMGLGWILCLNLVGRSIRLGDGLYSYFRSNILRYLPGSIWHYPGRGFYAGMFGISIREYTASITLELLFLLGTCAILVLGNFATGKWIFIILPFLVVLLWLASFLVVKLHRSRSNITRSSNTKRNLTNFLFLSSLILVIYFLIWGTFGTAISVLIMAQPGIQRPTLIDTILKNTTAWGVGFISLSPLGIGVREISLSAIFQNGLGTAALLAGLFVRVIEVVLELFLWILSTLYERRVINLPHKSI